MRKGEPADEVFIAPDISVHVYIDEDDVAMCCLFKIENGMQMVSQSLVLSMGPVIEVICEKLTEDYTFVVAYTRTNGISYAKQGVFSEQDLLWSEEIQEEPTYEFDLWPLRN